MPINKSEVSKVVDLGIPSDIPADVRDEIKSQVGDYLVTAILDEAGQGVSPVSGRAFKQLSKEYADEEKGGDRTSNMDLNGDMLNSLTFVPTRSGVKVGIFESDQAIKAYNHNVGDTLPKRQFIPQPDQKFTSAIESEVRSIVKRAVDQYRSDRFEPDAEPRRTPSNNPATRVTTGFSFESFIRGLFNGDQN